MLGRQFAFQTQLKMWISSRLLFNRKTIFGGSGPLSFLGLVLGVAALVASQSVMSGYELTLKQAVIDVTGDIQIVKRGRLIESWDVFLKELQSIDQGIEQIALFANSEAVLSHQGKVSGVLVQGVDSEKINQVLKLQKRIRQGGLPQDKGTIAIGTGLSKKLSIQVGQSVYLAVPLSTPFESNSFQRSAQQFKVVGILDFGKNDWNERLIISNLTDLQLLTKIGNRYTGAFIKLNQSERAIDVTDKIEKSFEPQFYVNNWYNINRNLLEAVHLEKIVIFLVVFLIVFIAAFNISSTLYVLIRARYKEISILKTLGFSNKNVRDIFIMQGFIIGTLGTFLGFLMGLFLSYAFMWLQTHFQVISGAVYKIDRIDVKIDWLDILIIYFSTLVACVLAAYFPAHKGSQLSIIEGMRQE